LAAAIAAGMTLGFSVPTSAAGTLDANVTVIGVGDPVMSFQTMAQTFVVVNPGQLSEVDLHYGNLWFASAVKAQIWTVSGGNPAALKSTALAAGTVPFTADWHSFTFTPMRVDPGQTFAIVLTSGTAGSNRWSYNAGANYKAGTMLVLSRGSWSSTGLPSGAAFLFRTYVQASAGLSIAADSAPATAVEGTAPTKKGTYAGATGAPTFSADAGTVAADTTAGTWTWTGDKYDEDKYPSAVTVTVADATGPQSVTFPVTISGAKPTASISVGGLKQASSLAPAALSTPEGTSLTLNASANSPDAADQAGTWTYTWKVTKNGTALTPASGAAYTVPTKDEDTFVVAMTAMDDGGMTSDAVTVTVVGSEIKPVATINSILPADAQLNIKAPQETLNFSGTCTDPAPEAHTYHWAFGDGASSPLLNPSHAYAFAGTYTVTLTVMDDEGVADTATAHVTILSTQQSLAAMIAYVQTLSSLNKGQQNSLIAKLNAASDASARGNNNAAHNQLNAFLNELDADRSTGKISAAAYNTLRADTHAVQSALGTLNRFLEWWPPAA